VKKISDYKTQRSCFYILHNALRTTTNLENNREETPGLSNTTKTFSITATGGTSSVAKCPPLKVFDLRPLSEVP